MTKHDEFRSFDDAAEQLGSDRSFGFILGGIIVAFSSLPVIKGGPPYWIPFAAGAVLVLLGFVRPALLRPLNKAWMKLGLLLGRIITPLVMFAVFAATVVPIGLLLRAFGKDVLRLKRKPADESYWIEREPPGPEPSSLERQF